MKLLQFDTGGRPLANDDLQQLQGNLYHAIEAPYQGAPAMVLSGCQLQAAGGGRSNISAGYLWIASAVQFYAGANNVRLPVEVVPGPPVYEDERAYQSGGSKPCLAELSLTTQAAGTAAAGTERVVFGEGGPTRTYAKWLESRTRYLGELQEAVNLDSKLYDGSGRGYDDRARAGWALANGQNGTADLRGRFRVAYSDVPGDYNTPGTTGGAEAVTLTTAQLPAHTHDGKKWKQSIQYDRGSTGGSPDWGAGQLTEQSGSAGGGQAHENRPPYYVTVVWQWIGL